MSFQCEKEIRPLFLPETKNNLIVVVLLLFCYTPSMSEKIFPIGKICDGPYDSLRNQPVNLIFNGLSPSCQKDGLCGPLLDGTNKVATCVFTREKDKEPELPIVVSSDTEYGALKYDRYIRRLSVGRKQRMLTPQSGALFHTLLMLQGYDVPSDYLYSLSYKDQVRSSEDLDKIYANVGIVRRVLNTVWQDSGDTLLVTVQGGYRFNGVPPQKKAV
jgi:hypothetical protein